MLYKLYHIIASHHETSESVANFSTFSNPATPRMYPVWDFVVGIFARKAMFNMGWVLSILSCQYLNSKYIYE